MIRIAPLPPDQIPAEVRPVLEFAEQSMGFTPNDVLTMARWPELLQAMLPMVGVIFSPGAVPMELKRLVATIASAAAGCQYCVAHNALGLQQEGVAADKQAAIWEFDTHAAQTPSAVTDADFTRLSEYFDDREILELTAVIALFGFLNRWNASLGTTLETLPMEFAETALGSRGWTAGVHDPAESGA
jgi:alkylhydroperoxidase family enzyme